MYIVGVIGDSCLQALSPGERLSMSHLGEFEHLVLLAVLRLDDDAYAVTIRDEIVSEARRTVSFGAVYSTLRRLENKGYLSSSLGGAEPVRGGRSKKYVRVTDEGLEAVRAAQDRIARMSNGIPALDGNVGPER